MHPFFHAASSARRHGGRVSDYLAVHAFFDDSKRGFADSRHRAIRHHDAGIEWAVRVFGETLTNADAAVVGVRELGQQHIVEDLGRMAEWTEWTACLRDPGWMPRHPVRRTAHPAVDAWFALFPHRMMAFHAEGIFWCEAELGVTIPDAAGRPVPVRPLAEDLVREALGRIPVLADWLRAMRAERWMSNTPSAFARDRAEIDAWLEAHADLG